MSDCYKCKYYPYYKTNTIQNKSVELKMKITCNGCDYFKLELDEGE